ncbi:MAG: hypothetical protein PUD24_05880 [Oscillospiraceae bacterium]|nr:hypothetical protein [Oscillospiraceae bacterium]
MTKKSKLIALFLTLIICLSAFSITCFAVDDVNPGEGGASESEPVEPPAEDPVVTEAPPTEDPGSSGTSSSSGNDDNNNSNSGYEDYNNGSNENNYNSDNGNSYNNSENNYYSDNNSSDYSNNNENDDYVSEYNYEITETQAASQSDLYKSNDKIDVNELSDNDWNAIAKSLENATDTGGGDDFNFIKKNTSSADNGIWMLILGASLIILSILGIGYVVLSALNKKNKYAYAGTAPKGKSGNYSSAQRPRNDYGDNYSGKRTKQPKFASKHRMEDTADIQLPRNVNGGSHYKH